MSCIYNNKTVLEVAFPDLNVSKLRDIKYKDIDGNYVSDILILDSCLPNRIKNIFTSYNLDVISKTLFLDSCKVCALNKMGEGSYQSFISFISNYIECVYEGDFSKELFNLIKNSSSSLEEKDDIRVIDYIFPRQQLKDGSTVFFKIKESNQIEESYLDDVNLDDELTNFIFSVRTRNCLVSYSKKNNVNTLKNVLFKKLSEIENIKNMGEKSFKELISFFRNSVVFEDTIEDDELEDQIDNFLNNFRIKIVDESIAFPYDSLLDNLRKDYREKIVDFEETLDNVMIEEILHWNHVFSMQSNYVFYLVQKETNEIKNEGVTKEHLENILPDYFQKYHLLEKILDNLISRKLIVNLNNKFQKK